jgi:isopentenyl phosphate kinase
MEKEIIIIKLGGSIITDKNSAYTANLTAIRNLARQIQVSGKKVVIVHGQGSFAHTSASEYGGKKGYQNRWGIAKVARDAMEMNRIVMDQLLEAQLPAISFRPNSLFMANEGELEAQNIEPVKEALRQGLIPVLYGDVIMDNKFMTTIFSGEKSIKLLVDFLSPEFKIKYIVQVGSTNGVLDKRGETIPKITVGTYEMVKKDISVSENTDVTGGMLHKVEESILISEQNISTYIINGTAKNELINILKDKPSSIMTKISNI